ncbi:hypothetical protein H0H93_013168 [Arthromyces matolae]|nr:hypothetical protein H0H93_013168 [Arthromyces matolae]
MARIRLARPRPSTTGVFIRGWYETAQNAAFLKYVAPIYRRASKEGKLALFYRLFYPVWFDRFPVVLRNVTGANRAALLAQRRHLQKKFLRRKLFWSGLFYGKDFRSDVYRNWERLLTVTSDRERRRAKYFEHAQRGIILEGYEYRDCVVSQEERDLVEKSGKEYHILRWLLLAQLGLEIPPPGGKFAPEDVIVIDGLMRILTEVNDNPPPTGDNDDLDPNGPEVIVISDDEDDHPMPPEVIVISDDEDDHPMAPQVIVISDDEDDHPMAPQVIVISDDEDDHPMAPQVIIISDDEDDRRLMPQETLERKCSISEKGASIWSHDLFVDRFSNSTNPISHLLHLLMSKRKRSSKPQVERYFDEDITDNTLSGPAFQLTRHLEVLPTTSGLSTRRLVFEHVVDSSDICLPPPSTKYSWNSDPNPPEDGDGSFPFEDLDPGVDD